MTQIRFRMNEISLLDDSYTPISKWYSGHNTGRKQSAIYVRQSTGNSTINDQIKDCCNKAKENKCKKLFVFEDKGSAWKQNSIDRLYGLDRMILAVKKGYIDIIYIYDVSRLSRNMDMEY